MKKLLLLGAILPLVLAACKAGETDKTDTVKTGATACPADQVISDVTQYTYDVPEAGEDLAAWHAELAKQDGITTLESGLQYSVFQSGPKNGPSAVPGQVITANYHGFFPDGSKFDSSYDAGKPMTYPSNRFIKGWNEALTMMKPCDAWTLYIPYDIAYGENGKGPIPPRASLVFHMQLLEVHPLPEPVQ